MSITDELRKWGYGFCGDTYDVVIAIANRIDAEYQKAIRELNNLCDASVLLPVDADGVPIRISDAMVLQHEVKEKPYVVQSLTWDGEDWYFTCDEGLFNACGWEHHHAPTVEDVLEEYRVRYYDLVTDMECKNITNDEYAQGIKSLNAEYAAKLRLADNGKERQ